MGTLKRYLIAGILIWVPLGVTFFVIKFLINLMDRTLLLLPAKYQPETLFGFSIPGLGVVLSIVVVLVTGMIAANLFGRQLVAIWESLLNRIPLVRSIYTGVKQVIETLFSTTGDSFRQVLLIQYPRLGIYTIAFQTNTTVGEVQSKMDDEVITVFVPTTPNPTSGFILMIPRKDVMELDMSVDEGLKMIISLGVVVPKWDKVGAEALIDATRARKGGD
ncbi:MAG: DUF502 domain-containing protein [Gammaproteobacteria bacterium]|nr:DUF502 domain-containing protein [Gammaproteobacteria bacterium]MDH5594911.1 DUF502 domain-containing protein [Gammaproteobacteria bacterium]MDH5613841.1 DUF502 domain-containing protein [Gammaproteobacteria bacterium]